MQNIQYDPCIKDKSSIIASVFVCVCACVCVSVFVCMSSSDVVEVPLMTRRWRLKTTCPRPQCH